jgi:protein-L-isoaspartate(D-aspartate) O-methyltransferase
LLRCNAASMTPIGNARMSDNHTDIARRNMVDSQILPNKVTDERIIDAMSDLPREKFLPNARRALAYADESVLIEDGRYMMQPMVLARLLETADLQPGNVALAIGCASGYGVAVLAKLADTVVAIEPDPGMRAKAERTLGELGIDNVAIVDGDLHEGHPTQAPFDVIYFDGAVPVVPDNIARQLGDGGRLVAVEMPAGRTVGSGVLVSHFGEAISKRDVFDASEHMLPGFEVEAAFSF